MAQSIHRLVIHLHLLFLLSSPLKAPSHIAHRHRTHIARRLTSHSTSHIAHDPRLCPLLLPKLVQPASRRPCVCPTQTLRAAGCDSVRCSLLDLATSDRKVDARILPVLGPGSTSGTRRVQLCPFPSWIPPPTSPPPTHTHPSPPHASPAPTSPLHSSHPQPRAPTHLGPQIDFISSWSSRADLSGAARELRRSL